MRHRTQLLAEDGASLQPMPVEEAAPSGGAEPRRLEGKHNELSSQDLKVLQHVEVALAPVSEVR